MYLYQLNYSTFYDYQEEEFEQPVIFIHSKEFNEKEFQNIIRNEKFEMGRYGSFHELVERLESYGFKKIVNGYYRD